MEISCSSTTFIKEVFAVDERIRKYSIVNLHCQSTMAAPGPMPAQHHGRPNIGRGRCVAVACQRWPDWSGPSAHLSIVHPHSIPSLALTRSCSLCLSAAPHRAPPQHNCNSVQATHHRRSLAGRFVLATATTPSPPPPRATNNAY